MSGRTFDYTVNLQLGGDRNDNKTYDYLFTEGLPAIFEDNFDPRLEYVPKSFYVTYITDFDNKNRAFGPYLGSTGTLVSNAGVTVDSNSFKYDAVNGKIWADFSKLKQMVWNGSWPKATIDSTTSTTWYTHEYCNYEVHYQLRVKDEYVLDGFTAENTATVYPSNPFYKYPASHSATVKYGPEHVKKDIAQINGSTLDVEILINEKGLDLVPNTPAGLDKTKFTAVDTMSGDLSFYLSTIEIYTQTGSKGSWSGTWKTVPEPISTTPGALFSIDYIDGQTVEFILPNETPIKIVYKAMITVPVGQPSTFRNEISVYGYSDFFGRDNFVLFVVSAT